MVQFAGFFSWKLFGGLFLGWGIGANDSANIFGTAVATNSVRYKTAVWLIAIFVVLGASCQGWKLYKNYEFGKKKQSQSETGSTASPTTATVSDSAFTDALLTTLAAAIVVLLATVAAIPASTSQAAIGACLGLAIAAGGGIDAVDWGAFGKMLFCWVLNPFGAALVTVVLVKVFTAVLRRRYGKNLSQLNQVYTILLLVAGCYGAYELGANN
ncbi:MAG TPA: inorganic phosphate transporter, partial [Candidatus Ozemobacteraceae bacterium]|nr:inorganic phosphate transporter [Candidatus Ozemobacteraceae bacterium]